ncbi:hypothetical protein [Sphaerotilus sp.]|uniref:hypothetical protein n=1 Tax=Sphaerotilus sp. TaxID=2093942 RepID=UPI00286E58ED|nr:hypothetical protein [Sphaerotilus sp.]
MSKRLHAITLAAVMTSGSAIAGDDTKIKGCLNILTSGVFAQSVESACGYRERSSQVIKYEYGRAGCPALVQKKAADDAIKKVLTIIRNILKDEGEEQACMSFRQSYDSLTAE